MVDRLDVTRWLDMYLDAWRGYDRDAITRLFTEDCAYRYRPEDEPVVGADAIAADWLADRDEPGSWDADYGAWAVDGDRAVATGVTRYTSPDGSPRAAYYNIFLLEFAPDGRCGTFTEVFRDAPDPAGPLSGGPGPFAA